MAFGLEAMTGILPTVLVAGVAMKMTERLFPSPNSQPRRASRRTSRKRSRRTHGTGVGNFSNLGIGY